MIITFADIIPPITVKVNDAEINDVLLVDTLECRVRHYRRGDDGEYIREGDNLTVEDVRGQITIEFPGPR